MKKIEKNQEVAAKSVKAIERKFGTVVSAKDKTAVVLVTREYAHPVYGKRVKSHKKYHAHDENNACKVEDEVQIELTRPLSKLKCWRVVTN